MRIFNDYLTKFSDYNIYTLKIPLANETFFIQSSPVIVFWIIEYTAPIYFRMSGNSSIDNINRVENPWSQKLSCQIWQLSKLLVNADLHTSLAELS